MTVLQTWAQAFANGWDVAGRVVALIMGGAVATALLLLALVAVGLAVAVVASFLFDRLTHGLAARWQAKGKRPRGKLAEIIMGGLEREE